MTNAEKEELILKSIKTCSSKCYLKYLLISSPAVERDFLGNFMQIELATHSNG